MSALMRLILAVALIALCGCDSSGPPPKNGPPSLGPGQLASTERIQQEPYPTFELNEMRFASTELEMEIRRIDAAAGRVAPPGWPAAGYERYPTSAEPGGYYALWCTEVVGQGYVPRDSMDHNPPREPRPHHYVLLSLWAGREQPETIERYALRSVWLPETGWAARVLYGSRLEEGTPVREHFAITLFHDRHNERYKLSRAFCALELGTPQLLTDYTHGDLTYGVRVLLSLDAAFPPGGGPDAHVIGLLESAAGFRDGALAEMDELESLARTQILSGEATESVIRFEDYHGDGGNPFWKEPLTPENDLTAEQRHEILEEALAEIERRRALIREHYGEMYEAVNKAFPLPECLEPIEKPMRP